MQIQTVILFPRTPSGKISSTKLVEQIKIALGLEWGRRGTVLIQVGWI